jgi:ribonuclease R
MTSCLCRARPRPCPKLPTKAQILDWIAAHPGATSKRDIAKAFHVKGAARIDLKRVLKELEDEGHLEKRRKTYRDPDKLPPVAVLQVLPPTIWAICSASRWNGMARGRNRACCSRRAPPIRRSARGPDPRAAAGGAGRRSSVRRAADPADRHEPAPYPRRVSQGGRGRADRADLERRRPRMAGARPMPMARGMANWSRPNRPGRRAGWACRRARIVERLGDPGAPKAVSLIAIHEHGIPDAFPDAVVEEADACEPAGLAGRTDLRDLPLVTIDPADARDRDDAVHAHADDDPKNPGGHVIWVAIADVAHYVTPGSALDREARKRGNSTYFPDRVVPMLPDTPVGRPVQPA